MAPIEHRNNDIERSRRYSFFRLRWRKMSSAKLAAVAVAARRWRDGKELFRRSRVPDVIMMK